MQNQAASLRDLRVQHLCTFYIRYLWFKYWILDPTGKDYACMLKGMADGGLLTLSTDHVDWRGNDPVSDRATAYDNIKDACDGKPALR